MTADNEALNTANEEFKAEIITIKASKDAVEQELSTEREKIASLTADNKALEIELNATKADLEAQAQTPKTAELEAILSEKTAELLTAQAEIEKLRGDLVYQNKSERIAYAHTNTFFIMEEKMGRFYRDSMFASEEKIGIWYDSHFIKYIFSSLKTNRAGSFLYGFWCRKEKNSFWIKILTLYKNYGIMIIRKNQMQKYRKGRMVLWQTTKAKK